MAADKSADMSGIRWDAGRDLWYAEVYYRGSTIFVGRFENLAEAQRARGRIKRIYGDPRKIPPRPQNLTRVKEL